MIIKLKYIGQYVIDNPPNDHDKMYSTKYRFYFMTQMIMKLRYSGQYVNWKSPKLPWQNVYKNTFSSHDNSCVLVLRLQFNRSSFTTNISRILVYWRYKSTDDTIKPIKWSDGCMDEVYIKTNIQPKGSTTSIGILKVDTSNVVKILLYCFSASNIWNANCS